MLFFLRERGKKNGTESENYSGSKIQSGIERRSSFSTKGSLSRVHTKGVREEVREEVSVPEFFMLVLFFPAKYSA